jgi:hypothetical protein
MVAACTTRHLFIPDSNRERETIKSVKGMLVAFVREVVTDPNVAPNHGWRHSFKTRGRDAGIADSVWMPYAATRRRHRWTVRPRSAEHTGQGDGDLSEVLGPS